MLSNSDKFNRLVGWTIDREGRVYEETPGDPGGGTRFGISHQTYKNLDIKNLTEQQAKDIYYRDYWVPLNCETHDDKMALAIFDAGVNCGIGNAKSWVLNSMTWQDVTWKRMRYYVNLCKPKNGVPSKYLPFLIDWTLRCVLLSEFQPPS